MGGSSGKSKKTEAVEKRLSDAQRLKLVSMFNVTPGGKPDISQSVLMQIWVNTFSDKTVNLIVKHLFKEQEYIRFEDLELFYLMMMEGTTNDRAKLLVDVFGTEDNIPVSSLKTYLPEWIEDYIVLYRRMFPNLFSSWTVKDTVFGHDLNIVTEFILKDLSCTDEKGSVNDVELWLEKSIFLSDLLDSLMKAAFNMEINKLGPILPVVNMQSRILSVPLALVLAHLIDPNMKKGWRLLYSPEVHAHSWSIFCKNIIKQGPSIVLIEHPDGQLFGGYASQSWKLCPTFYGDENSFLFQLRPKVQVFPPTCFNNNFQYLNSVAVTLPNGLGMGGIINYFTFFLSSDLGPAYISKSSTTFRDYVPFNTINSNFNFSMLEIWATEDPDKEEQDRHQGLIMDRDPAIVAVLELAGKTTYSQHIRNEENWHINLSSMENFLNTTTFFSNEPSSTQGGPKKREKQAGDTNLTEAIISASFVIQKALPRNPQLEDSMDRYLKNVGDRLNHFDQTERLQLKLELD